MLLNIDAYHAPSFQLFILSFTILTAPSAFISVQLLRQHPFWAVRAHMCGQGMKGVSKVVARSVVTRADTAVHAEALSLPGRWWLRDVVRPHCVAGVAVRIAAVTHLV